MMSRHIEGWDIYYIYSILCIVNVQLAEGIVQNIIIYLL